MPSSETDRASMFENFLDTELSRMRLRILSEHRKSVSSTVLPPQPPSSPPAPHESDHWLDDEISRAVEDDSCKVWAELLWHDGIQESQCAQAPLAQASKDTAEIRRTDSSKGEALRHAAELLPGTAVPVRSPSNKATSSMTSSEESNEEDELRTNQSPLGQRSSSLGHGRASLASFGSCGTKLPDWSPNNSLIPPSTFILAEAFQENTAGDTTRRPSVVSIVSLRKTPNSFKLDDLIVEAENASPTAWHNRLESLMKPLIMHPASSFQFVWEIIGLALVIRDIISIPFSIIEPKPNIAGIILSWIARLFWTADLVMGFLTGFVNAQGSVTMRPRPIAIHYMRTRLHIDLFLVMCGWSEVFADDSVLGWNFLSMLRAMRLARLVRMVKNQKKILEIMIRSEGMFVIAAVAAGLVALVALIHVISCIWFALQPDDPEELLSNDRGPLLGTALERYLFCFHVMLSLFLGDQPLDPQHPVERFFVICVLFISFVVSAAFLGCLTTAMTRLQIIASGRSAQFAALSNYLTDVGISRDLAFRVQRNARHVLKEQSRHPPENSVLLLTYITEQLRAEIHHEMYFKDLSVHPFFRQYNEVNSICMRSICHTALSVLSFSREDVVFTEFEVPAVPRFYLVISGRLVYNQTAAETEMEVRPKTWMSEMLLWTKWAHKGSAQAVVDCRLVSVHAEKFQELLSTHRAARRYVIAYARSFVEVLNMTDEGMLTDIGEERVVFDLMKHAFFSEGDPRRRASAGISTVFNSGRRHSANGRRTSVTSISGLLPSSS